MVFFFSDFYEKQEGESKQRGGMQSVLSVPFTFSLTCRVFLVTSVPYKRMNILSKNDVI